MENLESSYEDCLILENEGLNSGFKPLLLLDTRLGEKHSLLYQALEYKQALRRRVKAIVGRYLANISFSIFLKFFHNILST